MTVCENDPQAEKKKSKPVERGVGELRYFNLFIQLVWLPELFVRRTIGAAQMYLNRTFALGVAARSQRPRAAWSFRGIKGGHGRRFIKAS